MCHPLYLRVPPLLSLSTFLSRGQRDLQLWPLPTKLHTGRSGKRTCAMTLLHFSLLCFDAMVVHVSPPKPFPPQQRCSLSRFVTAVQGNNHCSNTYNFSDLSPCCSTAILPIVVTELTEYNCQSVFRSAVPLGC